MAPNVGHSMLMWLYGCCWRGLVFLGTLLCIDFCCIMSSLDINSRKYMRTQVTKFFNTRDTLVQKSDSERKLVKSRILYYKEELDRVNKVIQQSLDSADEKELIKEWEMCDQYFDKINAVVELLHCDLLSSSDKPVSQLRRQTVPLPVFNSSESESIEKFLIDFEATVLPYSYTERDKLLILKQQVKGRASFLLNSLETDKQTYGDAKSLLVKALGSSSIQKYNTLKMMSEMKLDFETDPFAYISQMTVVKETFKTLTISVDDVMQYFFWQGLNLPFQEQLTSITNNIRPTLAEIEDNIFQASERYIVAKKQFNDKKKSKSTAALAINASAAQFSSSSKKIPDRKDRMCVLCPSESSMHTIQKCTVYSNAADKVARLKELNLCSKCTNGGHSTKDCKFKLYKKCFHCNGWHFTFLCVKPSQNEKSLEIKSITANPVDKPTRETVNKVMVVTGALPSVNSDSLLPTFSFKLSNGTKFRGLVDSGCQNSFVTKKVVMEHNFKTVEKNVNLTVQGFNASQQYQASIVKVECWIGSKHCSFEAFCVPTIDIVMKVPSLNKIVKEFQKKNYVLLDENLENVENIKDIELILGTSAAHCLIDKTVLFGVHPPSVYKATEDGVMILGNVDTLNRNLEHLPYANVHSNIYVVGDSVNYKETNKNSKEADVHFIPSTSLVIDNEFDIENSDKIMVNYSVTDDQGNVNQTSLARACDNILAGHFASWMNHEISCTELQFSEINIRLVKYALENATRTKDGRLVFPLFWNESCAHLLGKNFNLCKSVLESNFRKLSRNLVHLNLMDETFKIQEKLGIIEKIADLDTFMIEHPESSFLAHMGVFKLERETTKCRVVFLSNVSEKDPAKALTVNHNQAMHSGPSLNQKISSSILHLKFGEYILCYDIKKAFSQIMLNEVDQNKLLFLWYENVTSGDLRLVGYKSLRLPFGLRCSPTILMLAMYKILVIDSESDYVKLRKAKRLLYQLLYMDNGAFTADDSKTLNWMFDILPSIFSPFQMELQQLISNDSTVQEKVFLTEGKKLPDTEKLLGLQWSVESDELSTRKLQLNESASTKRLVLSSIASNYDVFNINGPILNRARLFMQDLQYDQELGWDDTLPKTVLNEWKLISRQVNATPEIKIGRCVGKRSDRYKLLAYVDASSKIYGVVLYILNLRTNEKHFLLARNRLVSKKLVTKSIPSLELMAIVLGVEVLHETRQELGGPQCLDPIDITGMELYSDSFVALCWLNSSSQKFDKMQKRSVFVLNRIERVNAICKDRSVLFSFINGKENPSDFITREISYKTLVKSNYFCGPELTCPNDSVLSFTIPREDTEKIVTNMSSTVCEDKLSVDHLIDPGRFSSLARLINVHATVLKVIDVWKKKCGKSSRDISEMMLYRKEAWKQIIVREQDILYPELRAYFASTNKTLKATPNLVSQLNLYPDENKIIRVNSKFDIKRATRPINFPVLLAKASELTELIILDVHERFKHVGCYALMSELRREFWIPKYFTSVKKVLRKCIVCRRFNSRPIKLNQSSYREFRLEPSEIPFSYVYMDHCGPWIVRNESSSSKVWILVITCMFTRAINLKICTDLTVGEFLRSFMLHTFEYGLPQFCVTDLGSQLVAGANTVTDFLKDMETKNYFSENGVKPIEFSQYFKGCSELGALVESCVKMTKYLIHKSIKRNVLTAKDFQFLVCQAVHIINRRPVAFKDALRDDSRDIPLPITPEELLHGYNLISMNVIPDLQPDAFDDHLFLPDQTSTDKVRITYHKLKKVRANLLDIYHKEFLVKLIDQATDVKDRYLPVHHVGINVGDIVLVKDSHTKAVNYPMGIVREVFSNIKGEVTAARVMKGSTGEVTKRHVSDLIPLLTLKTDVPVKESLTDEPTVHSSRPLRKSAAKCRADIQMMIKNSLL